MRTKFKFTRAGTASGLKRGVVAGLALATLGTGAPVLAKSPQAAEGPYIAVVSLARHRVTVYS